MCGIVGSFVFDSVISITRMLLKMRDTMTHRGPDGGGLWLSEDRRIGLGHRRLSIIDLSPSASQPMTNEDGSLQVVFNGEIYNHAEIRKELEALGGHRWKTSHSDTEVILHAFEQWGIDCLERFRGMFAIGLWDARTRSLWLIRDRVGVKPLYCIHGRLTFASKSKRAWPTRNRRTASTKTGCIAPPLRRRAGAVVYKLPPRARSCRIASDRTIRNSATGAPGIRHALQDAQ